MSAQIAKNLQIFFCSGWAYASHFRRVKSMLEAKIPGIQITGSADYARSGCFEIVVQPKGTVVYSKLATSQFPDNSQESMDKLIADIQSA